MTVNVGKRKDKTKLKLEQRETGGLPWVCPTLCCPVEMESYAAHYFVIFCKHITGCRVTQTFCGKIKCCDYKYEYMLDNDDPWDAFCIYAIWWFLHFFTKLEIDMI